MLIDSHYLEHVRRRRIMSVLHVKSMAIILPMVSGVDFQNSLGFFV